MSEKKECCANCRVDDCGFQNLKIAKVVKCEMFAADPRPYGWPWIPNWEALKKPASQEGV